MGTLTRNVGSAQWAANGPIHARGLEHPSFDALEVERVTWLAATGV